MNNSDKWSSAHNSFKRSPLTALTEFTNRSTVGSTYRTSLNVNRQIASNNLNLKENLNSKEDTIENIEDDITALYKESPVSRKRTHASTLSVKVNVCKPSPSLRVDNCIIDSSSDEELSRNYDPDYDEKCIESAKKSKYINSLNTNLNQIERLRSKSKRFHVNSQLEATNDTNISDIDSDTEIPINHHIQQRLSVQELNRNEELIAIEKIKSMNQQTPSVPVIGSLSPDALEYFKQLKKKKKHRKPKKGSLTEKLNQTLNRAKSAFAFWQHKRNVALISPGTIARIRKVENSYGIVLLHLDTSDGDVVICVNVDSRIASKFLEGMNVEVKFDGRKYELDGGIVAYPYVDKILLR